MSDDATIFVEQLHLDAQVGVYPKEQGTTQTIALDIDVGTAAAELARAAHSERLRDTINYERIASRARAVVAERHFPLVETLADRIAGAVAGLKGATWVRVRLRKLGCLDGAHAAGVQVFRPADEGDATFAPIARADVAAVEDVIIVGGGAAGLSAALWCWRLGHAALIVDPSDALGGQLHVVHLPMIDLPASAPVTGPALAARFRRQLDDRGGRWLQAAVQGVEPHPSGVDLTLDGGNRLRARTAIIAAGLRRRTLDVPGERDLVGRGVLATATRDADALGGKRVVVIGGGDAACDNALLLDRAGAHVTIVHRRGSLAARAEFRSAVTDHPRIACRFHATVTRFVGDERLTAVEVTTTDQGTESIDARAALVRIGWVPESDRLPPSWCDARGFLRVESSGRVVGTERVFGAGDLIGPAVPCIAASAGSGACAARSAVTVIERD